MRVSPKAQKVKAREKPGPSPFGTSAETVVGKGLVKKAGRERAW
jgi:hypothetical protein